MSDRSKHIIWVIFLFQVEQALIVRQKQAEHALFFLIQKADVSAFQGIGASACEMFCADAAALVVLWLPRLQLAQP